MSSPKEKPKSRFIVGLMYDSGPEKIISELEKEFGKVKIKSDEYDFNFTDFYEKEFGKGLKKVYMCFEKPFDVEKLPEAKLFCSELENKYLKNNKRLFNIDPGYITENSVVLASFKPRAHRIYLKKNVYADLQLVFENSNWKGFKWTFFDITSKNVINFLTRIKETTL